ncbi:unnamed protein product [Owenia fusiformis]|uniref:Methyltransferase domain-containing protein n=1 Tax=Owenia fusiformis TaxID=6347 RepID=A0A8S4N6L9_OWEFU|nr:unnamed protein product [Owenia fusiformis]
MRMQFRIILVAALIFLVLTIWNRMFRYASRPLQNWQRANGELLVTRDDWYVPHNFTIQMLNAASITESLEILSSYFENKQLWCPSQRRFGREKDGGKDIYVTHPFNLVHRQCTVYSFGIGRDFSFDDEIAETCEVYSYDPTIGLEDHIRGQHVHFSTLVSKAKKVDCPTNIERRPFWRFSKKTSMGIPIAYICTQNEIEKINN